MTDWQRGVFFLSEIDENLCATLTNLVGGNEALAS